MGKDLDKTCKICRTFLESSTQTFCLDCETMIKNEKIKKMILND